MALHLDLLCKDFFHTVTPVFSSALIAVFSQSRYLIGTVII